MLIRNFSLIMMSAFVLILTFTPIALPQRGSYEIIDGDRMYYILPRDGIPAIDNPEFVSVKEAEKFMKDDELVMGLVINGDARAYSTWHLDRHEIVNDFVGDTYISVTW